MFETPEFFKKEMKLLDQNAVRGLNYRLVKMEEFLSTMKLENQKCTRTNNTIKRSDL